MKKILSIIMLTMMALTVCAKDIKTAVFTTNPQMHCEKCEQKIKGNLRFERGVKKIVTSVPNQTITITFDADKTTVGNIIKAFDKIGYEARQLKDGEKVNINGESSCGM